MDPIALLDRYHAMTTAQQRESGEHLAWQIIARLPEEQVRAIAEAILLWLDRLEIPYERAGECGWVACVMYVWVGTEV